MTDQAAPTQEQLEAQARIAELHKAIKRFNKARLRTEEYVRGLRRCRVPREQVSQVVMSLRDGRAEEEAAQQLLDLQRLMLGREPTPSESASGVPGGGLSGPWLVPGVVAGVAAGAWVLSSIFTYLAEHEARIQRELDPGAFTVTDVVGGASQWLVPMAVVGGIVVGGYYLLAKPSRGHGGGGWLDGLFGKKKARPSPRLPTARLGAGVKPKGSGAKQWPPAEDELELNPEDEDDLDDDNADADDDDGGEGDES